MKNLLKSKLIIILTVIGVILLCTACFFLGAYSKSGSKGKSADNITNIPTKAADITSEASVTPVPEVTLTPAVTAQPTVTSSPVITPVIAVKQGVVYHNTQFGFDFKLKDSWEGYQILSDVWEGTAVEGTHQGEIVETGVKIIIRHPGWSDKKPYQDIPIMVFTYDQWDKVQDEKISLGAAPIGPSWLGSNSKYVFALPARYNFGFALGTQQVDKMLNNNSFIPNENFMEEEK